MMQVVVEWVLLGAALGGFFCIVLATVYDVRRIYRAAQLQPAIKKMTRRSQPHVTILVTDITDSTQLLCFLRQLKKGRYGNYDVVAVGAIHARQRQLILRMSPIKMVRFYAPRATTTKAQALKWAYRWSQRGELVALFRASDMIEPMALRHAVVTLQQYAQVNGVVLTGGVEEPRTLQEIAAAFTFLGGRLVKKAVSVVGWNGVPQTAPVLLRSQAFKKSETWGKYEYVHGLGEVSARTESVLVSWYRWVVRVAYVCLVVYGSVIAATLIGAWPLGAMWALVCVWLAAAVWSDETTQIHNKWAMGLAIPVGMFLLGVSYTVDAVRSLLKLKTF